MAADVSTQVYLVLRLTLGFVFLGSALAKLRDAAAFVRGVLDYHVLPAPLARVYGRLLPFVELGTALLLLSGFFIVLGVSLAVLMLVSFTVAVGIATVQGRESGCNCFGVSQHGRVGWHTLVRDLLLLAPAAWLLALGIEGRGDLGSWLRSDFGGDALGIVVAALLVLVYWVIVQGLEFLVGLLYPQGRVV